MILDGRDHLSDRGVAVLGERRLGSHVEIMRGRDESIPAGESGLRREEERAVRFEVWNAKSVKYLLRPNGSINIPPRRRWTARTPSRSPNERARIERFVASNTLSLNLSFGRNSFENLG